MVHIFFQKKCVSSLVVPISSAAMVGGGSFMDHMKRALEPVPILQCTEVEYEEEELPCETTDHQEEETPLPAGSGASSNNNGANNNGKPAKKKAKVAVSTSAE